MIRQLKLLVIAGARPNFMKVAPLIKFVQSHNRSESRNGTELAFRLVHTGQHYDEKMSEIFFSELGIPAPDINLGVGSGSHAAQTAGVMAKFESVCENEKPDWVIGSASLFAIVTGEGRGFVKSANLRTISLKPLLQKNTNKTLETRHGQRYRHQPTARP